LLVNEGWHVNHKRVERIWRQEGLKVPQKQPKRRRLWLNDGSCVRLRPQYAGHVWSYDFVQDRTHNGRTFRMLKIIDEFTCECLSIDVDRRLTSDRVLERLTDLFAQRGAPDYIRSDNGSEFTGKNVRKWLRELSVKTRGVALVFKTDACAISSVFFLIILRRGILYPRDKPQRE
jgi:transposase InsO family protein